MASLAYYNLGLVALERHDEIEARDWFERSVHEAVPDERLKELATQRIEELPESRAPGSRYYYSRGGIGHDDNVALRSASFDSAASGQADTYGELVLATTYSVGQWRIDSGASLLKYQSLHDFDQNSWFLGGARGFTTDHWYFELGAVGSQGSLGGDTYEHDLSLGGQATRLFRGGGRLRAQLRSTSVDGQGAFTGLTGTRTEYGLYYNTRWRAWGFGAHARSEKDNSQDLIFASRWTQFGADADYAFSPLWSVALSGAVRRTQHPQQSETIAAWNDNRATLLVGITRLLWKRTQLFVRYAMERNDSPVAGYDYNRNWITASVETWR
jgi:hypothetical protein